MKEEEIFYKMKDDENNGPILIKIIQSLFC